MFNGTLGWKRWLATDPALTLEQRFFQGLCLLSGVLSLFVVIPVNHFQHLNPWVNVGVMVFGVLSLGLAWLAWKGHYLKSTLLILFIACLDLLWFPNGGSHGSIGLYFFIAALYLVLYFDGAVRYLGIGLVLANILALQVAEFVHPQWLQPFHSETDRLLDLFTGYLVCMLTSALILWVLLRGFRKEQERYHALFENMFSGFILMEVICDRRGNPVDHRLLQANSVVEAMTGLKREGELGKTSRDLTFQWPPEVAQTYYAVAMGAPPISCERYNESLQRHFDIRVSSPRKGQFALLFNDISDRKRAEAARFELEAQVHQIEKMESLGSLAGGVAHDMNNVLGAILGLASTHQRKAEPASPLARDLDIIVKACHRGGTLVKGLLGFARKGLAEERELDLNALVREELALLERTTLQRIRLVPDLAEDLRPIKGDPGALAHALMNLCVNALDAMNGGGLLVLRTRNEPDGTVVLEVEDDGCGMSREVLDRALDPFFTTKPQGKGTGLGLSIVYATVKAHEGRMELHSEPGLGTRVTLAFPACQSAAEPAPPAGQGTVREGRVGLKVLLVDDDEFVREAILAILEALGHQAAVASGGEGALVQLEAGLEPDVVILDMNMPGLDGAATLPRIRSLNPDVPVLLATGRVDERALGLIDAFPGVTLLSKPFDIRELQERLALIG